jgi:hypothetical protein
LNLKELEIYILITKKTSNSNFKSHGRQLLGWITKVIRRLLLLTPMLFRSQATFLFWLKIYMYTYIQRKSIKLHLSKLFICWWLTLHIWMQFPMNYELYSFWPVILVLPSYYDIFIFFSNSLALWLPWLFYSGC